MEDISALQALVAAAGDTGARVDALKRLGAAYEQSGGVAEAAHAYHDAYKLAPRDLEVIRAARRVYALGGKWPAVVKWLQAELALTADEPARARLFKELGETFQNRLNDFDQAQQAFAQARQHDPGVFTGQAAQAVAPRPEPAAAPPAPAATQAAAQPAPAPPSPAPPRAARPAAARSKARPALFAGPLLLVLLVAGLVVMIRLRDAAAATLPDGSLCPEGYSPFSQPLTNASPPSDEVVECARGGAILPNGKRYWLLGHRVVRVATVSASRLDGPAVELSGDTRAEGAYLDGQRDGPWKEHQADGGLLAASTWAKGVKHGPSTTWYPSGGVREQGEFDGGVASGEWSRFSEPGELLETWHEPRPGARPPPTPTPETAVDGEGQLFAGQTVGWWRIRLAELQQRSKAKPELEGLYQLTVDRARLLGLAVDPTTGTLGGEAR